MNGGAITGGDQPNCVISATGIELNQSAQATLKNIVSPGLRNIAGNALRMRDTSKATVSAEPRLSNAAAPAASRARACRWTTPRR